MKVRVRRHWPNRVLCWHGRRARRLLRYNNGLDVYCSRCHRKRLTVYAEQ